MIGKTLMLLALPISGILAQPSPIHLVVSSQNGTEFGIRRITGDSVGRPIFGRGVLELLPEDPGGFLTIAVLDTVNNIHVEATQAGRVIASGDGRYFTVRRDEKGIAIEARSDVPESSLREIKRP